MKVYVRLGVLEAPEPLREYTLRKIHLQLSRFGREISAVSVRLSDVNGPKGGEDIRCHLGLHGPNLGTISIDERSTEATVAIDMAADRAARIAGRELERARAARRLAIRAS